MFTKNQAALVLLSIIFISCGDDDDDKGVAEPGPVEDIVDGGFNLARQHNLPGTSWSTGCHGFDLFAADIMAVSARATLKFAAAGTDITRSYTLFSDGECTEQVGTLELEGSYILQLETAENINPVDLTFRQAYFKASSESLVNVLNPVTWCGGEEWTVNERVEITATVGQGLCQIPQTVGATTYDLILTQDETVYLGSPLTSPPTSEAERPAEVDKSIEFKKQ